MLSKMILLLLIGSIIGSSVAEQDTTDFLQRASLVNLDDDEEAAS